MDALAKFESLPRRVFLDTCCVNFILDHEDEIFEGTAPPGEYTPRAECEVEAFRGIFLTGRRADWELVVSYSTYDEVRNTRNQARLDDLLRWTDELWQYWKACAEARNEPGEPRGSYALAVAASGVLGALPDDADRLLVSEAIELGCDAFCTMDWKTILRRRQQLPAMMQMRILSPCEWWDILLPWAALWV